MRVIIIFFLLIIFGFIGWQTIKNIGEPGADTPVAEAPAAPTTPDEAPEPVEEEAALPSFDIVRVDRSGRAVIAGRAAPEATVTVFVNDKALDPVTAGPDGSWILVKDTPLEQGAVELSLEMTTVEGLTVRAEDTILIYVPARDGDLPLVLRTTPGGATEVLQDPREAQDQFGPLTLDVIDYDDSGAVIFSGRAEPNKIVQLFIDTRLLGQTRSDENGNWMMAPDAQIAPGVYQLLVLQLGANGRPDYAIEVPFKRATADEIELRDGKVIVQPGNSLWRIARRAYGSGAQYTIIYEANEDQIRDPDLIFPGQIFDVPEDETDEE